MAKLLLVSSAGGHLSELMQLRELNKHHELVICTEDRIKKDEVKYYLKYGSRNTGISYFGVFLSNIFRSFKIIRKEKPQVLISTGAHTCVPFFWWAKIFGVKSIYIESYAKVNTSSLTYKLIKPFVNEVIVQHEQMLEVYPEAKYLGGVY